MTRFIRSQTGAVLLWIAASLLLAAVWVPWLYVGGKQLAAAAAEREVGGFLEWLGAACGRAQLGRFFNRALLVSALALLPLLLRRVRRLAAADREPHEVLLGATLAAPWRERVALFAFGFMAAAVLLGLFGWLMAQCGAFAPKGWPAPWGKLLTKAMLPALGASVAEELVFRGVLLGLWLRVTRPWAACAGSSLVFAVMHFLSPAPGFVIADPGSPLAGLQLLGGMLWHFTDPRFFVADFLTLFAVGLALAFGRLRTGSLWMPMGLHCGWVLVFKIYHMHYLRFADGPVSSVLVGNDLRSGIFPLMVILITSLACHFAVRFWGGARQAPVGAPAGHAARLG